MDLVTGDPRLCLARAWLAFDSGEPAAAEHWADATAAADNGRPLLEGGATVASSVAMLRATLAYRAGDLTSAEALGTEAVELENRPDSTWRAVALATLGAARHFRGSPSTTWCPCSSRRWALPRPARTAWRSCGRRERSRPPPSRREISKGREMGGGLRPASRRAVARGVWMGSLASAVAGQLAAAAGNLGEAASDSKPTVLLVGGAPGPAARPRSAPVGLDRDVTEDREPPCGGGVRHSRPGRAPPRPTRARRGGPAQGTRLAVEPEELSDAERAESRLHGSELSVTQIGEELYDLAQDGQDPRARDLSKARRGYPCGGRG